MRTYYAVFDKEFHTEDELKAIDQMTPKEIEKMVALDESQTMCIYDEDAYDEFKFTFGDDVHIVKYKK